MTANNSPEQGALVQLATGVLDSPEQLRQLSERVYALLCTELRQERDRAGSPYRRRS